MGKMRRVMGENVEQMPQLGQTMALERVFYQ